MGHDRFDHIACSCLLYDRTKKETQPLQGLGRSRGGLTTKLHVCADAFGEILGFLITPGQAHDCPQAQPLLEPWPFDFVLGDRAYDSQRLVDWIESRHAQAVIPSKGNRRSPREYDRHLYRERHAIECTFGWMKYFRRVATRFDKLLDRFADFAAIAASIHRIRYLNNA